MLRLLLIGFTCRLDQSLYLYFGLRGGKRVTHLQTSITRCQPLALAKWICHLFEISNYVIAFSFLRIIVKRALRMHFRHRIALLSFILLRFHFLLAFSFGLTALLRRFF